MNVLNKEKAVAGKRSKAAWKNFEIITTHTN